MPSITRRSPSLILATGALVLALGGTASALPGKNAVDRNDIRSGAVNSSDIANGQIRAVDIAFGSVSADQIADGAVNSLKLLDGSVTGTDVQDGSLTGADVQNESLESQDIKNNSLQSEDVQNNSLTGEDIQDNSVTGTDVNEATLQGIMPAQTRFVTAQTGELSGVGGGTPATQAVSCPAGERAIGGGGAWLIPTLNGGNDPTALDRAFISASMPTPAQPGTGPATGWQVAGRNVTGTNRILRVYAICVPNQIPAS